MPKILVAGDVGGDLASLFQRVATVNSGAAGPFECLFCVGEVRYHIHDKAFCMGSFNYMYLLYFTVLLIERLRR